MANDNLYFDAQRIQSGRLDDIMDIRQKALVLYSKNSSLYDAQDSIKRYLLDKYGNLWWETSGDAVNFIIESAYMNKEKELCEYGTHNVWY